LDVILQILKESKKTNKEVKEMDYLTEINQLLKKLTDLKSTNSVINELNEKKKLLENFDKEMDKFVKYATDFANKEENRILYNKLEITLLNARGGLNVVTNEDNKTTREQLRDEYLQKFDEVVQLIPKVYQRRFEV